DGRCDRIGQAHGLTGPLERARAGHDGTAEETGRTGQGLRRPGATEVVDALLNVLESLEARERRRLRDELIVREWIQRILVLQLTDEKWKKVIFVQHGRLDGVPEGAEQLRGDRRDDRGDGGNRHGVSSDRDVERRDTA